MAVTSVALTAAVVVVAMAARAPLSRSTPVDASSAQAPIIALLMVAAGFGIVMLGGVVAVAWSGRQRKDDPPERTPPPIEIPWWWKAMAMLLPLALGAALVVAAVSGARRVKNFPSAGGGGFGAFGPGSGGSASAHGGAGAFVLPSWLPWTVLAAVLVAIAGGIFVLLVRNRELAPGASDRAAAGAAVQAAIGALGTESDPRRAVIAAYGAMQRTLGEHGVVRSPAEAPREYLQRALTAGRAPERETRTLTGLFEEARYSVHPIPERLRELALSSLRSLQRRLREEGVQ